MAVFGHPVTGAQGHCQSTQQQESGVGPAIAALRVGPSVTPAQQAAEAELRTCARRRLLQPAQVVTWD